MSRKGIIRTKPKQSTSKKEKDGIKPLNHYKMLKKEKNLNQPNNSALHKTAVMRSVYAVYPDGERLDIGQNRLSAIFRYKDHAEEFAKSKWVNIILLRKCRLNISHNGLGIWAVPKHVF